MNDHKNQKLRMFANDTSMNQAVYELVQGSFLGKKGSRDVQILAAERLAVELLDEAWKKIEEYRNAEIGEVSKAAQIGM